MPASGTFHSRVTTIVALAEGRLRTSAAEGLLRHEDAVALDEQAAGPGPGPHGDAIEPSSCTGRDTNGFVPPKGYRPSARSSTSMPNPGFVGSG